MKKRFGVIALALVAVLSCSAPAMAMPQPAAYEMGALSGICADGGDLLVTDVYNKVVWRFQGDEAVRAAGRIAGSEVNGEPVGGYVDGGAKDALFTEPWAVAPYLDGFAVTDAEANVVRWFNGEAVQTIAGSGKEGNRDAGGTQASFHRPTGLAAGPDGALYVADTGSGSIRRISTTGQVTTWFRGLSEPTGICWADGALYVAETGAHCVSRLSDSGRVVLAGTAGTSGYRDGPAGTSLLRAPLGVAVGPDGAVYIADTGNSAIRRLKDGRVTTLASGRLTPEAPVRPRGLLVQGNTLLATDTLAALILELPLAGFAYSDVAADNLFAPYVAAATERGITFGTGGGQFSPNAPVTRAMFVTMLARMHRNVNGDEVINGDARFSDVAADSVYASSINWCAEQGLVLGDNGRFLPDTAVSRQALVTILYRYAGQNGYSTAADGDLSRFPDGAAVSDYARDAMAWAVGTGLLSGDDAGRLNPADAATRAQTTAILIRFMDAVGI